LILDVTMLEIQGGSVRLGLDVNTVSPVYRCEAGDRIRPGGLSGYPTGPAMGQAGAP
jgi:sRNA-binding carbon storage regulator CsrA